MKNLFNKLFKSLTGRLTLLFITVHLATVVGLSSYQYSKFAKQLKDGGFLPLALIYDLENLRSEHPDFDVTDRTQPAANSPTKIEVWHDMLVRNPQLWFYYEKDGEILEYGRSPILISDVVTFKGPQRPEVISCTDTSLKSVYEGYNVTAGYRQCNFQNVIYEVGGVEPNYYPLQQSSFLNNLREELRLGPALLSYLGLILLMPLLIYGLVSPIRRASEAALKISPYSKRKRLPVDGMLFEVRGLADATNKALKKLDAGYVRERWLRDVIAHEIRTPLMVLRGYIEDVEVPETRRNLTDGVKRANRVLERLMEFSAATSLASSPESLDIARVARAACAETGAFATRQGVEYNLISDNHQRPTVMANRVAVMLILTNILNNAIRHSGSDKALDVEVLDSGEVQIRDYGSGMDIEALNKFFHKFATLDERLAQRKGLGLIIVAELTEFCGGEISAFATTGGGLGFSLSLPQVVNI